MNKGWVRDKQKSAHLGGGVFNAYKSKLKEKLKEQKAKYKDYKHKRKSLRTLKDENHEDFLHLDQAKTGTPIGAEHNVELSISIMSTNALAPALPPHLALNPERTPEPQRQEEEEDEKDVIEYYTLYDIVELVTSPKMRGTQDQTVLLHTYCLYSTRQFSQSMFLSIFR